METAPETKPAITALIVAAGRGMRAGGGIPKQYRILGGEAVLSRTIRAFQDHPSITEIQVVIHGDDLELYHQSVEGLSNGANGNHSKLNPPVHGGASRAESVLEGLNSLSGAGLVLVHDAARPFVSHKIMDDIITALKSAAGAAASLRAIDAMRRVSDNGEMQDSVARDKLARMQTPQGFQLEQLRAIMTEAQENGTLAQYPDEVSAAKSAGLSIIAVQGDAKNFKLTTAEDFEMAEAMLNTAPRIPAPRIPAPRIRVGQGFDVHAFAAGDHVTLCGIQIPFDKTLSGHSDADVGLHALTDALLGAIANGDIGQHFPPSDPQWKGADSVIFLEHALKLVRDEGFEISNLDITLICEQPKIGPHKAAMRERIAQICALDISQISVKATTTERLGFCGREEGIAAQASVALIGNPA